MGLETGNGCVTLSAGITYIGFLSVVYVSVEFHVNPLGVDLTASGTTVGFSPVCNRKWVFKLEVELNLFPHSLHS